MNDNFLKSDRHAMAMVAVGCLLVFAFKGWKFFLRQTYGFDPLDDYFVYESFATIGRVINAVVAGLLIVTCARNARWILGRSNSKAVAILIGYLGAFTATKLALSGIPSLNKADFVCEVFFNLATGFSEEFIFRGLLLIGIGRFIGFYGAAVFSSVMFMAFHFDVDPSFPYFLALFLCGMVMCMALRGGVSLLVLGLIHFIWDQMVFGFKWGPAEPVLLYGIWSAISLVALVALALLWRRETSASPT